MLKLVSTALSESVVWRLGSRRFASSPGVVAAHTDKTEPVAEPQSAPVKEISPNTISSTKPSSGLVAAAFASLNSPEPPETSKRKPSPKSNKTSRHQQVENIIASATDLNTLLSIAESPFISRKHAFKVVSLLSEWSSSNKVKLEEFETDARFLRLCRVLALSRESNAVTSLSRADDLSTVLAVTGDDEAARLVSDLTLPQMIKVLSVLRARGRRSTPLLRSLAHHLTRQQTLNVKQAADLLYSTAHLNFPDPPLMDKVCNDIMESLSGTERVAGVQSCLVSLGVLRYRHTHCLDALCGWVAAKPDVARPQDVRTALLTLATLNYRSTSIDKLLETSAGYNDGDLPAAACLELWWARLLLDAAPAARLRGLLAPQFTDNLYSGGEIPLATRRKLQLIGAYVGLVEGEAPPPALPDEATGPAPVYTREKAAYVAGVLHALRSLVASDNYVNTNCTSLPFLYDAEFAVDNKCHPVSLEKAATDKSVVRIAVLALDYHDFTRKTVVPLGINNLYIKLLELKGYKVLLVPYTEFSCLDKPVSRAEYLQRRLRDLVTSKRAS